MYETKPEPVEPFGLPPVDELRESVMQAIDELRAYLGGHSSKEAAERGLAAVYASLEVEADKSPGWKRLEEADS